MRCKKCGQKEKWTEKINKGISQIVTYEDGFITQEITTYEKEGEGVAVCGGCGAKYERYNL